MSTKAEIKDTRMIEVPVPSDPADTETLGKFILNSAQDGYLLTSATAIQGGSQRDPFTIGLRVILTRQGDAESDLRLP
jgi:hypothetical protein